MSKANELYNLMKEYQLIMKERETSTLMNLGSRLKTLRTQKDLTQEGLALMIGLSRTSITNIERGKQDTTVTTLVRISCALECSLNDLFSLEDKDDTKG
jgi:DNA-binding XRE family transcriptional regulator